MENFKVVVIGASKVGKTSLMKSLMNKPFSAQHWPTKQAQEYVYFANNIKNPNKKIELRINDLPGSDHLKTLNRMYLREANVAIILYDVSSRESLEYADQLMIELKEYAP